MKNDHTIAIACFGAVASQRTIETYCPTDAECSRLPSREVFQLSELDNVTGPKTFLRSLTARERGAVKREAEELAEHNRFIRFAQIARRIRREYDVDADPFSDQRKTDESRPMQADDSLLDNLLDELVHNPEFARAIREA